MYAFQGDVPTLGRSAEAVAAAAAEAEATRVAAEEAAVREAKLAAEREAKSKKQMEDLRAAKEKRAAEKAAAAAATNTRQSSRRPRPVPSSSAHGPSGPLGSSTRHVQKKRVSARNSMAVGAQPSREIWFVGTIQRREASDILKGKPAGTFVIRT